MTVGLRQFWRDTEGSVPNAGGSSALWQAAKDATRLRYLDGGGAGCSDDEDRPKDHRKIYHHLTFYGFLLCFAATSLATLYHYVLQREAPYAFYDLPVILGTLGGIGLLIGPAGLLAEKLKTGSNLADRALFGMETAFIAMLFLTSLTGIALLLFRGTAGMGPLLALHLGAVFGLFITLPYGKFVHGLYRYAALVRYAGERRAMARTTHG
jgi:citrate/tricarballylate utilization protein